MKTNELQLQFKNEVGKATQIVIRFPKPDLTEEEVQPVMQAIVDAAIYKRDGELMYAQVVGARYVEREVKSVF
ncbi:DUF2922 domain-containing protein [Atopobacter phocae]|uniref:DUF2922 domain-containing protein n=1 Tax=Atopobacter phocae TaxID=136492 RepID=UPI00046E77B8|nr:DUF2922 domain-containing protein [Atopobacter phocae]